MSDHHIEHENLVPKGPQPLMGPASTDVLFTRGVLSFLGLAPKNIMLTCGPYRFVAVLQIANGQIIRAITSESGLLNDALEKYENLTSIRIAYADPNISPLDIPGTFQKFSPYLENPQYKIAEILLDQPVPQAYTTMLSSITDVKKLAKARNEPRITFSEGSSNFGIQLDEAIISLNDVPQRCYVRDLSPSGSGVIILNSSLIPADTNIRLVIRMEGQFYPIEMEGHVLRSSWYDEGNRLLDIVIIFDQDQIPISYDAFLDNLLQEGISEGSKPL
ncbi:MAG: PilZ domain-containing protein [Spirochaetia bacterium]